MPEPITGRVWVFGDHVDTDVMYPAKHFHLAPEQAVQYLFDGVRPGWAAGVTPGDLVVGGTNFGVGSARPVGSLLRIAGIRAVLAESMSSLFQRNCINAGVFAVAVPGITALGVEGDVFALDPGAGIVSNGGRTLTFAPLPEFVADIVAAGGILEQLRRDGFLDPAPG